MKTYSAGYPREILRLPFYESLTAFWVYLDTISEDLHFAEIAHFLSDYHEANT